MKRSPRSGSGRWSGGCPHAAIREDITPNLLAFEESMKFGQAPEVLIFDGCRSHPRGPIQLRVGGLHRVRDRRGWRGQGRSKGRAGQHSVGLVVTNKTDPALVGASLQVMDRDAR